MRQFLIGPSIGGAKIRKVAWDYLIDQSESLIVKDMKVDEWKANSPYKSIGGVEYVRNFSSQFRDIVKNLVLNLHYDYTKLDELNGGVQLRIIDIPDDGNEYTITSDWDTGAEYVTQVHVNHYAKPDWYMKAKYEITEYGKTITDNMAKYDSENDIVHECAGILYAFDEKLGVARVYDDEKREFYFILERHEYYKDTDEHPRICYEIINSSNSIYSSPKEYWSVFEMDEVQTLYNRIKNQSSAPHKYVVNMTPITRDLIETYTNKLLNEYEWLVGTAPYWDLECPPGEEIIYFGVQLDGGNDVSYIITANIVYRDGVLDEHNYDVSIGTKPIEESESCYLEELEAVIDKYMKLAGKKKKE